MSGPYVYTPTTFEPTPFLGHGPYAQHSPFIPPATLYPSSPYPPSSPYTTPSGLPFDDTHWNPYPRPRRPSWHGMPPSPYLSAQPTSSQYRRRSFGGDFRSWEPTSSWASSGSHFQIHPILNGEAPLMDFDFNLASPFFAPVRWIGPGQSVALSAGELSQPATYPPITQMRITHDAIPQWPIDLEFRYDGYAAPATLPSITLGDVLYMIHASLHRQITHQDWAILSPHEETEIARAYTRRYKRVPSSAQVEASQGVKRVDYLRGRHHFRGLTRGYNEDGFYHWRLITA